MEDSSENSPEHRQRRLLVDAPGSSPLPGLAALTALMLLCSVLLAKTLAYMVESLESPQAVPETQALSQQIPAPPFHRRALSDKFLRMGVDDIATGSIRQSPDKR